MGSAAEAEISAGYINGQDSVPIRTTLIEMGHPQPPTPLQVDNTTARSFANGTMKQKRSKSIDMNFYWLQDRKQQSQFHIYCDPGKNILGDYHSKHHSPSHHRQMRPTYLHAQQATTHLAACLLRGCAKTQTYTRHIPDIPDIYQTYTRHIQEGDKHTLPPLGSTLYRTHNTKYAQLTTRAIKMQWLNHSSLPNTLIS